MSPEPARQGVPDAPAGAGDVPDKTEPESSDADASPDPHPSVVARVSDRVQHARTLAEDTAAEAEHRFPPLHVVKMFVDRYLSVNGVVLAGHLAFRTFTFLLPVAFVIVAIAGVAVGSGHDPGSTAQDQLKLGQALGESLRTAGSDTSSTPVQVGLVALSGLVLGSLGLLSGLHYVFREAWQIQDRKLESKVTKLLRFTVGFILLMVLLLGASALRNSGFLWGVASVIGMSAIFFVAFLGLSLIMPRRCHEWYWLIPGALVGAVAFIGLQAFANFYIPNHLSSLSRTYGTLAIAVVLISYLFLIGQVVVASAVASAVWFDWRHDEPADGDGTPAA
jgi:uncharacterized BrkB/YihY/UPF0761 family membrane protein